MDEILERTVQQEIERLSGLIAAADRAGAHKLAATYRRALKVWQKEQQALETERAEDEAARLFVMARLETMHNISGYIEQVEQRASWLGADVFAQMEGR